MPSRFTPYLLLCAIVPINFIQSTPEDLSSSIKKEQVTLKQNFKLDDNIIAEVLNPALKQTLQTINKNEAITPLKKKQATKLLLAALEETSHTLELVQSLLNYYKKQRYTFSKHEVMKKALEDAPVDVVQYLLEKKIYDERYFNKKHHRNYLLKLDQSHLIANMIDMMSVSIIPRFIATIWGWFHKASWFFYLISWVYDNRISAAFRTFDSYIPMFPLTVLYWVILIGIGTYKSTKISIVPGYLFYLFADTKLSKEQIAERALLLLKFGAKSDAWGLIVKNISKESNSLIHQQFKTQGYYAYSYLSTSALHLATYYNIFPLVKKLVELGAKVNGVAVSMKDKMKDFKKMNIMDMISGPFDPIVLSDLYNGKKGNKQTPLDLAYKGSKTAKYLQEHGAKHYSELQATKNPKVKVKEK